MLTEGSLATEEVTPMTIEDLPFECLVECLMGLSCVELSAVAQVSTTFKEAASADVLWRNLCVEASHGQSLDFQQDLGAFNRKCPFTVEGRFFWHRHRPSSLLILKSHSPSPGAQTQMQGLWMTRSPPPRAGLRGRTSTANRGRRSRGRFASTRAAATPSMASRPRISRHPSKSARRGLRPPRSRSTLSPFAGWASAGRTSASLPRSCPNPSAWLRGSASASAPSGAMRPSGASFRASS
jgi:hypothetical protein